MQLRLTSPYSTDEEQAYATQLMAGVLEPDIELTTANHLNTRFGAAALLSGAAADCSISNDG